MIKQKWKPKTIDTNLNAIFFEYRIYLKKIFPQSYSYILNGDLFIKISIKKLKNLLFFLNNHTQSQFKIISDITAIDYPWKKNRFEVFYNLLSILFNARITVFVQLNENQNLESVVDIYKVANWFEREIWDLFGIFFKNHPDLRRILTDYGFKGHPLRKDFPLTGFIEVRYFHNEKRILVEEISLTQDFRTFLFSNNWQKTI